MNACSLFSRAYSFFCCAFSFLLIFFCSLVWDTSIVAPGPAAFNLAQVSFFLSSSNSFCLKAFFLASAYIFYSNTFSKGTSQLDMQEASLGFMPLEQTQTQNSSQPMSLRKGSLKVATLKRAEGFLRPSTDWMFCSYRGTVASSPSDTQLQNSANYWSSRQGISSIVVFLSPAALFQQGNMLAAFLAMASSTSLDQRGRQQEGNSTETLSKKLFSLSSFMSLIQSPPKAGSSSSCGAATFFLCNFLAFLGSAGLAAAALSVAALVALEGVSLAFSVFLI